MNAKPVIAMDYKYDYLDKKAYNTRSGAYKFGREYKFIIDHGRNNFDRVLDIAGGSGRFAMSLLDHSKSITVVDINKAAIQLLRERNSNINSICGDFVTIDLPEKYSLILCVEAMGYFPDFDDFFSKINTLLKDNGRLILTYNNPSSWRFYLSEIAHWIKGPYPYNNISLKELREVLSRCSLEIENMEGMNWLPFPVFSNNPLVSFFGYMERILGLKKWLAQSPWILMSIKKRT